MDIEAQLLDAEKKMIAKENKAAMNEELIEGIHLEHILPFFETGFEIKYSKKTDKLRNVLIQEYLEKKNSKPNKSDRQ